MDPEKYTGLCVEVNNYWVAVIKINSLYKVMGGNLIVGPTIDGEQGVGSLPV